jgi:pyrroloquinoline quinone (PQQ) biosynthesis protein C
MSVAQRDGFMSFQRQVDDLIASHEVVRSNPYTAWFEEADLSLEDVRQFAVQFSVFSNQFLVAQLKKMINAETLESMRESKEILANEIGVMFRSEQAPKNHAAALSEEEKDRVGDPDLVGTEGSVEGGTFHFRAGHFEWLLRFGKPLGLTFEDMGKRRHGWASTLYFCDELARIYGDGQGMVGMGASYSVEHWAAAGFWKQLIRGLASFKQKRCPELPLAFFTWHDRIEDNHAAHTENELLEAFERPDFDGDQFLRAAAEMLDGVRAFWWGLDEERRRRHSA